MAAPVAEYRRSTIEVLNMTNFIPIFPLNLVVYPGEQLNLHIFEPRYKQLIRECVEKQKPFGIPSVIDNRICDMGTLAEVVEVVNTNDKGEMDIRTRASSVFKILEMIPEIPDKLYNGAIVTYPTNITHGNARLMKKVVDGMRALHKNLGVSKEFKKPDEQLVSYDVAHHIGLSLADEYRVLEYLNELHRQEFLKRHIAKVLPIMEQMDWLKNKIKLNGHFRELPGFNIK
ncbi:MAG TPA: LON peptidase substrate-binding domain-containing protein [Ferruginibacter sp.]|nr:LON peptidase substrate-binding domain-containing protein [Ferruginibacter sp.]